MSRVFVITGTRKGIGKALAEFYLARKNVVCGCSRGKSSISHANYRHFELDVSDESAVIAMIKAIKKEFECIDVLLNNAGIASMNHLLTTPFSSVKSIFSTNFLGSFLFLREVAKVMANSHKKSTQISAKTQNTLKDKISISTNLSQNPTQYENLKMPFRIVNFATIATPLRLEGEAIYAASKAAIINLTQIAAKELAPFGISVNAIAPTPVPTDLIKNVPWHKINALLNQQAIKRYGKFSDILNVLEFFLHPNSDFITAQIIYLGGVNG